MKKFKQFNEDKINSSYKIYFKRYSEYIKNNISDLYYDIEELNKFNIEYVLYYNIVVNEDIFCLYLFPDTQKKEEIIQSGYITGSNFNISYITNKSLNKDENIESIKNKKNADIIKIENVDIILKSNKFNI